MPTIWLVSSDMVTARPAIWLALVVVEAISRMVAVISSTAAEAVCMLEETSSEAVATTLDWVAVSSAAAPS